MMMDDYGDDNSSDEIRPREPRLPFKSLVLVGLLAILGTQVFFMLRNRRGNEEKAIPAVVTVDITALPEGAEIYIDGQRSGISNVHQEVPSGAHELLVILAGYQSKKTSATWNESQSIHVELEA